MSAAAIRYSTIWCNQKPLPADRVGFFVSLTVAKDADVLAKT